MTKAKTKTQEPEVRPPAAPPATAVTDQAEKDLTGDGDGDGDGDAEAQAVAAQEPEVHTGTAMQQPGTTEQLQTEPDPEDVIDVFVLCDGSLDGITRYLAGSVLQGVPESLAQVNGHWLDSHPAAVDHALNNGASVIDYQQEA